jgi:hypothetical protein
MKISEILEKYEIKLTPATVKKIITSLDPQKNQYTVIGTVENETLYGYMYQINLKKLEPNIKMMDLIIEDIARGERGELTKQLFGNSVIYVYGKSYTKVGKIPKKKPFLFLNTGKVKIPLYPNYFFIGDVWNFKSKDIDISIEGKTTILEMDNVKVTFYNNNHVPDELIDALSTLKRQKIIEALLPGFVNVDLIMRQSRNHTAFATIKTPSKIFSTKVHYKRNYINYDEVPFVEGIYFVKIPTKYTGTNVLEKLSVTELPEDVKIYQKVKQEDLPLTPHNVSKIEYLKKFIRNILRVYTKHLQFDLEQHGDKFIYTKDNYKEVYMAFFSAKSPEHVDGFLAM